MSQRVKKGLFNSEGSNNVCLDLCDRTMFVIFIIPKFIRHPPRLI